VWQECGAMKREYRGSFRGGIRTFQHYQKCKCGNFGLRQTPSHLSKDITAFALGVGLGDDSDCAHVESGTIKIIAFLNTQSYVAYTV